MLTSTSSASTVVSAQLRYAAFLIQQAVEKTLKGLLAHDWYQQDLRTHDIAQLVDECRNKRDVSRITVPAEISDNVDEIIGLYHRDVRRLPSDEIVSRVHGVLPSFMKSCFRYCGEMLRIGRQGIIPINF